MADLGTFITGDPTDTPADGDTLTFSLAAGRYQPAPPAPRGDLKNAATIAGVDPTGASDSTTALNAWLASPPDGQTGLWFPPGVYVASIKVTTPGLTLSASRQATIKVPSGATPHVTDAGVRVLADNITLNGLNIDGNQRGNTHITGLEAAENSDGIGIYADNCHVTGCHVTDPIGHGVIVWGLAYPNGGPVEKAAGPRSGTIITGNHIEGGSNRAALDVAFNQAGAGETHTVISGNIVEGNTFVLHSANDVSVTGNVLREGVSIHSGCERVTLSGNVSSAQPINILSSHRVSATGNVCQSLKVSSALGGARPSNVAISDNNVATTMNLEQSDGATITGNVIGGELRVTDSEGVIASGNRALRIWSMGSTRLTVSDSQVRALIVGAGSSQVRILNNDASGVGEAAGISISGTDIQVVGNRVRSATSDCIRVGEAVAATDILVADNVVTGAGRFDILIGALTNGARVQNNIVRPSADGVRILSSATGVSTINNGRSYGRLVVPPASTLAQVAPATWPSAPAALMSRFTITADTALRRVRFQVGASSGNVQVGVVKFTTATAYRRVMDSGIIACPASGFATVDLAPYVANPGDYAVFLWADNMTFSTPYIQSDVARSARLCAVVVSIPGGVPATGVVFEGTNRTLLGVAIETDF